jgi:hypothetical protein
MGSIRVVRWGVLLALLSIAFGFTMGALFGAVEGSLKGGLEADGKAALAERYGNDPAALKAVLDKSWVYLQRAHLHGGGIGAVALGLCLLLASLGSGSPRLRAAAAACAGAGALGYSVYWLLAGLRAPGMGGTSAAKASLEWLAVPASGLAIVGLLLTLGLAARALFGRPGAGEVTR